MQPVVALVRTAQERLVDAMHLGGFDFIPGVRQQLIVQHEFGTVERGQLDDVDEFGGLDDGAGEIGIERIAGDADIERTQAPRRRCIDRRLGWIGFARLASHTAPVALIDPYTYLM